MSTQNLATHLPIYQIKVTLDESNPPIWRQILVTSDTTLAQLHRILQVVMGWQNSHLHWFIVGGKHYGEPDPEDDEKVFHSKRVKLNRIVTGKGFTFTYEYDFGDSWVHTLQVEEVLQPEPDVLYPLCIGGQRATPPEDVGGMGGYEEFVEVIQNPSHEEHESWLRWAGGRFDPEAFDLEAVNDKLSVLWIWCSP